MKSFKNYITEAGQSAERQENGFVDAINNAFTLINKGITVKTKDLTVKDIELFIKISNVI